MLSPRPLEQGDLVRVIAPSSPFDRTLFWRGLGVLAKRFRVRYDPHIFSRERFLAGSDDRRRKELCEALSDPDARAVLAARGGYGLTRIIGTLAPRLLLAYPKWLVGFSDITALHLLSNQVGVMSLHASNLTGLGRSDTHSHDEFFATLEAPLRHRTLRGRSARSGQARGQLIGGNLTLMHALAACGRLQLPHGCVVALEDVGESSYQLDRMLQALIDGGSFDQVSGFAVGELSACSVGRYRVSADDVVCTQLGRLRVPIAQQLPFGHGRTNRPLTLGAPSQLDGSLGTLTLGCPLNS